MSSRCRIDRHRPMAADPRSPVTRRSRLRTILTLAIVAAGSGAASTLAQGPIAFTVDEVLGYPFPQHLIVSPTGSTVGWVSNERGVRNVYVAEGPAFKARRLTGYGSDDGQELSDL